jgi:hypothetical protein
VTLKGHYIEKNEWGIINWLRKNILQIFFFRNLGKEVALWYIENNVNNIEIRQTSVNNQTT